MPSKAVLFTPSIAILIENFFASLGDNKLDFKDLVIDIRKEKGRNYNAEIERKAYERKPRKEKAEPAEDQQGELF